LGGVRAVATTGFSWLAGPGQIAPRVKVQCTWPEA